MFRVGIAAVMFGVLILIAACQPVATPPAEPQDALAPLVGTEWILNELTDTQIVHEGIVTAEFGEDGNVTGSAGCNDYETAYETNGGELVIDTNIHSTEMDCDEAIMAVESAYLASLQRAASYEVESEVMFIRDGDGTVLLVFDADGE